MATLICRLHPNLSWSCKDVAVNPSGTFNHSRNIFFNGKPGEPECDCDPMLLIEKTIYEAESEDTKQEKINHIFDIIDRIELQKEKDMATHRINPDASFKQPVVQHDVSHIPTISERTIMNPVINTPELTTEDLHSETGCEFTSERLKRSLAFRISGNVGMIATRIQRLATGKGGTPDETVPGETVRAEIKNLVSQLAYGYQYFGGSMREIEEVLTEWCGGGYSRPASDADLKKAAEFLGKTVEEMKKLDATRRTASKSYLTIRREGLLPIMLDKITTLVHNCTELTPPSDDTIRAAGNQAYSNALLFGDWAEARLIQLDMVYHLGESPKEDITTNADQEAKAARIREALANAQAERAQAEAKLIANFDIDNLDLAA